MNKQASHSDCELLAKLINGDTKAYTFFVERHQRGMEAKAAAIAGTALAKDIVQDAWLSIFRNLRSFEGRSSLRTWLLVITANTAKAYLYKKRRDHLCLSGDKRYFDDREQNIEDRLYHNDSPEAIFIRDETLHRFDSVLSGLPQRQRRILNQYIFMNVSISDIAQEHDINNVNVRVILHRTRAALDASAA